MRPTTAPDDSIVGFYSFLHPGFLHPGVAFDHSRGVVSHPRLSF